MSGIIKITFHRTRKSARGRRYPSHISTFPHAKLFYYILMCKRKRHASSNLQTIRSFLILKYDNLIYSLNFHLRIYPRCTCIFDRRELQSLHSVPAFSFILRTILIISRGISISKIVLISSLSFLPFFLPLLLYPFIRDVVALSFLLSLPSFPIFVTAIHGPRTKQATDRVS